MTRAYAFDSTNNFVLSKSELLSNFHSFTSWLSACPPPETLSSSQSLPCRSSLLRMLQENSPPCWAPFCSATNFLAGCQRSLRIVHQAQVLFVNQEDLFTCQSRKEGLEWTELLPLCLCGGEFARIVQMGYPKVWPHLVILDLTHKVILFQLWKLV